MIVRSSLRMRKQNLSYHLLHMLNKGLIQRGPTGGIATWLLTEAGSKFLDMNENTVFQRGFITLENARFKYPIIHQERVPVDWDIVRMKNWSQLVGREGPVSIQKNPDSLVLTAGKRIGTNEWRLMFEAEELCNTVATGLEERLGMRLGRGKFLGAGRGRAHFEVGGDPVAEFVSEDMIVGSQAGSIGDKSYPHIHGSVTLPSPRDVTSYLRTVVSLPDQIDSNQRETMKKLSEIETHLECLGRNPGEAVANRLRPTRGISEQDEFGTEPGNDLVSSISITRIALANESLPQNQCPLTIAKLDQYDPIVNQ
jgi:hypothetical protein